jgi:hypothetical protein
VVTLTALIDAAVEARTESSRLRTESAGLRLVTRRLSGEMHHRQARCGDAYGHVARWRAKGLPSPWSPLLWHPPDAELDRVLVPL